MGTYGEREMCVVLEEDGDCLAEVEELERADVVAVKQDLAIVGIIQARDQLEDSTLPGSIRTNNYLRDVSASMPAEPSRDTYA